MYYIIITLFLIGAIISFRNAYRHYIARTNINACAWACLGVIQIGIAILYRVEVLPIKIF